MPITHQAWHIYFCPHCENAEPNPKDKLVVVLYVDSKSILGVFINTKSSEWLRLRDLEACEVAILAAEHTELAYDSFVDCQTVYDFNDFELTQEKGAISAAAKVALIEAVRTCPTIIQRHRKLILDSVENSEE